MSVKVSSQVWEQSKARGSALLLQLALADYSHDDGTGAWPGVETLARKCRMTARNVQFLIVKLVSMGELRVVRNASSYGTNLYFLTENFTPPVKGASPYPLVEPLVKPLVEEKTAISSDGPRSKYTTGRLGDFVER